MDKDLFRTIVKVENAESLIEVNSGVMFMGSCFAGNIGQYFVNNRFPAIVNPYGVLYNPLSISIGFQNIMNNRSVKESELVYLNGLWHSFNHHGSFSNPEPEHVVASINNATDYAHNFLRSAGFLFVTFGTANVYALREGGKVVANCHKFSENFFNRYLLNVDEIVDDWKELIVHLRVFNPNLNVVFTVSPVRHWRDGAHGNQVSKATLLLAIHKLVTLFDKVWYFPAYEIVLDELRDYRFYDAEMLQPNSQAVNYIWRRFTESHFSEQARQYCREIDKIIRARNHRASGHNIPAHRLFLQQMLESTQSLAQRYPSALLEQDRVFFQEALNHL